jgi:nitroreductase
MDVLDIIKQRRSIRAFEKRVPSKEVIMECLEAATWAPSATNQQPWEFIVATGDKLTALTDINREKFAERLQGRDAFGDVPEPLKKRQQEIFTTLLEIAQDEGIDPNEIFEKSLRFFDAPVGIYFLTYTSTDIQYCLSTAAAIENFLIAAEARGLGTCWLTVTVVCQEDIKKHLGISYDKELLAGIAVGYPAGGSQLNLFQRTRVPANDITTWLGF